jgi:hypothetical protein
VASGSSVTEWPVDIIAPTDGSSGHVFVDIVNFLPFLWRCLYQHARTRFCRCLCAHQCLYITCPPPTTTTTADSFPDIDPSSNVTRSWLVQVLWALAGLLDAATLMEGDGTAPPPVPLSQPLPPPASGCAPAAQPGAGGAVAGGAGGPSDTGGAADAVAGQDGVWLAGGGGAVAAGGGCLNEDVANTLLAQLVPLLRLLSVGGWVEGEEGRNGLRK